MATSITFDERIRKKKSLRELFLGRVGIYNRFFVKNHSIKLINRNIFLGNYGFNTFFQGQKGTFLKNKVLVAQ